MRVMGGWGLYFGDSTFLSVSVSLNFFLPASFISAPHAGVRLSPAAGSPGISVVLRGSVTEGLAALLLPGAPGRLSCGTLALYAYAT